MEGLIERVSSPSYATSVGLAHWGLREADRQAIEITQATARARNQRETGLFSPVLGFGSWLRRALLPERAD
jgi:hypothetical protein